MSQGIDKVAYTLPLLPLKDIVVFPHMILPVFVSEEICLRAVEAACAKERLLFLSAFQSEKSRSEHKHAVSVELKASTPPPFDVYDVGTIANVMRMRKLPDGRTKVLIQGLSRALLVGLKHTEPYPLAHVQVLVDEDHSQDTSALCRSMKEHLEKLAPLGRSIAPDLLMLVDDMTDVGKLSHFIASHLGLGMTEAQKILATPHPVERLQKVHNMLVRELELVLHAARRPSSASKEDFSANALDAKEEMDELREKVTKSGMSLEARRECFKQVRRLERMNPDSSEATLTRTYLEWMVELPWELLTETKIEMAWCQKVLDEDHFGLSHIKDRILEYIAVKKLNPEIKGPILCFVGPPGVGKTSLGKSIARAMGRKFVRMSLGGVRDEAEIRGHRRTYVGALPGRIVQHLKQVGSRNPVFMLDEIDKLGADFKGDPASALLEVLDPEQNHGFCDHYLAVPFDLSQVIFLANANRLETISPALRDRLEIIEISGYSEEEKTHIAREYLIPKVVSEHGLQGVGVQFQESAVQAVIQGYTKESGLRALEKKIAAIARKLARDIAQNNEKNNEKSPKERKPLKVSPKLVKELLGEELYFTEDHNSFAQKVGVCVGLAYTPTGGEILQIEAKMMPKEKGAPGQLILTGQLGDVMKESAQTALSCVRSVLASHFFIPDSVFHGADIHVHVPAGAIPKDGPSAGVALALALASACCQKPLPQNRAFTGELSLYGNILPIGGVREKILAALRAGIDKVCLPHKNKGSFAELPLAIKRRVEVCFVSHIDEVFVQCFETKRPIERLSQGDQVVATSF
jgi:ATP-dependent Lon protease